MSQEPKVKSSSQLAISLRRLRRHRAATAGGIILAVLYFSAIFADFIAPYPYDLQHKRKPYHPPMSIHFFREDGSFSFRPFVYDYKVEFDPQTYERIYTPQKELYIYLFVRGEEHEILGLIPTVWHLFGLKEKDKRIFLMGSDVQGRDIFSRIFYGGRVSLSIGIIGVIVSFSIGTIVGGISGYFGGQTDNILMRLVEVIMMIPGFYLLLALRAVFPLSLSSVQVYLMIVMILGLIGWAGLARIIRGLVLSIREREYVQGAQALGAGNLRIVVRHILPNTLSYTIVAATLSIPGYILGEAALSLLGLGIREPQASWGNMLSVAMSASNIQRHPWILIPGVVIFITITAFNFLGDGVRDAFDPKGEIK